jgi:hypothetical protein
LVYDQITNHSNAYDSLLVFETGASGVHVDVMNITMTESHKIQLKFPVRDGIVHGNVYMFKQSTSRGALFIHESMKLTLAVALDNECVCGRLRVSSGFGSISMSKTVYKYLFHAKNPESSYTYTKVDTAPLQEGINTIEKFERCVNALRKVEYDPISFAEDVSYLSMILRIPGHISRKYSRDMVENVRKCGGDIQRVIDVHSRATRISTLLSMFDE